MRTPLLRGAALAFLAIAAPGLSSSSPQAAEATSSAGRGAPTSPEARWGVRAVSLRPTMDGRMLDFRYRIVDAAKAAPLFDHTVRPYLFDPSRGAALGIPEDSKLGALRASVRNGPVAGKQYYMIFSNPYGKVVAGSKVTIVVGDCRFEEVVVQ